MRWLIILCSIVVLNSCNNLVDVDVPEFEEDSILDGSTDLSASSKLKMEGVYKVTAGDDAFGDQVVLKWSGKYMSIFSERSAAYFITEVGIKSGEIVIEGYWRYAANTETGLSRMVIPADEGAKDIISDTSEINNLTIYGSYGNDNESPNKSVVFKYLRPFSEEVLSTEFYILAHRGGGRTADRLPASENSLEMFDLAERLGANAIEIDVKLSKDRIPFLYHDRTINLRLVQKSPIWGNIEDFTFVQLKTLITLIEGEKIPSLEEALEFVLNKTTLELVWLDMKSTKNDVAEVIAIQKNFTQRAIALNRKLEIFLGLPTEDKRNHFLSHPNWASTLSLNELDPENVRETNSAFWGPRWTLGLQNDLVDRMHSEGRRVITWTMDDPIFIRQYLDEGNFDGMVTNYPTLVAYLFYSR